MGGVVTESEEEDELEVSEETDGENVGSSGDELNDEEEEEGQDEYEQDGFIVDEVEEEEEQLEDSDAESHRRRSKKKKRRDSEKDFVLDEDDYELLEDNNITGFRRPQAVTNKFKRLKKTGRSIELEGKYGLSDEESIDRSNQDGFSAEEKLKHRLFGFDEVMLSDDIAEEEEHSEDRSAIGDEDEMADFIVDEDVDEVGDLAIKKKLTKKKSHKLPGISSSALQEAKEIFGDVDELLMLRKQGLASNAGDGSCAEKVLEDEFEPFVLSEKYMTLKDVAIRETDVPERIQLFENITGPPPTDDKNIEEESDWIYDMLTHGSRSPLVGYEALQYIHKKEIENVLTMMHVQKLDIPFISMYRKELCGSLLKDLEDNMQDREEIQHIKWHKILWAIWTLDKKWLLLQKRLSALRSYYSRRFIEETQRIDDEARHSFNKIIFQSVISALNNAKFEREVDDIDVKFNMHFPPSEDDTCDGKFKRPKRKSTYTIFRKAGLWEIANKFGASSETFAMLLSLEKISDEVEDTKESPEEVAANYICSMFPTHKDVLSAARHMTSVEIAYEPNVKKHVRSIFMEKAVVSTSPTHQGNQQIDAYHPLGGVKWLRNKPLSEFVDGQWLLIQKGEEDKLLKVTIKLSDDVQNKLLSDAFDCYLSEGVSRSAKSWNDQREMILKDSFFTYIFPSMEKEACSLLTTRAKYWLRMEYGRQLWNKISIAPFQWNGSNSEDKHAARVMACCWGSGKSPTTIVMLDSEGEMVDVLYVNSFSVKSQSVADQQRKKNDQHQVLKFMMNHQPHVVCVGAANMACKRLSDDIYEVIFKIVEDHPTEVGQELENISTVFGDETLPCLYENSRVSLDQFPGQPGIVKRAVALGRYMQNPLAMVATLCGPGKEILSWKLHSLDHFLTPDEKYEVVEQIMVDASNQIGLDINLAASHEWLFAPLQFISGLGPRKASSLQKAFLRAGFISNRKEISMGKILKKKVFTNAVGFLRVRQSGAAAATSHIMDLLDDTRIHPESYELAKNVAKDIYDEDDPSEANFTDDDMLEMAIEHVRENPHMLKVLDINEYAKSIFNRYGTNKKETLSDIKIELLEGFRDYRTPFKEPSDEEKFAMLSGETNDTISEGRIVEVRVCHVNENQIICAFDSGLKGIVSSHDYSDEGYDLMKVHKGDILTCKIQRINTNRHVVYLTSKASDLRNDTYNLHTRDTYYVEGAVSAIRKTEVSKSNGFAMNHFTPRMIVHPRFQNLSADEATKHLSDKEPGESIIRPSSKGISFLTLMLKIFDGVYAHKQIIESNKDHKDMTSLLRLGKTLTIDKDTFEDLDEIMDRFVDPLVTHLRRMLGYRRFRKGTRIEVDDLLRAEKIANPMRIVYCFGVSYEHPGTFILSYIRNANPHHEHIGLIPKGFRFRNKDFYDIDRLVHHFQQNINKTPLGERPSLRTFAAVVPLKSNTWAASDGCRYTGDRFDSRNTNSLDGHPNGRGHDSQIHTDDDANNSRGDKVQNSAGRGSSGWNNRGTGGDQGVYNSGGAWQGGSCTKAGFSLASTGNNGDWSEYGTGSGRAVENSSMPTGWAADSSVGWGSGGTGGKWGIGSVAPGGGESTLDGSQRSWQGRGSSTGNWGGSNADSPGCSGRGRGRGRGRSRGRNINDSAQGNDSAYCGWSNAGGRSGSNNGGRIGRGGWNERGRGGRGRSWRGGNVGGHNGRGSSGCGGGDGGSNTGGWVGRGSGFAASSCEKSAGAAGSNDGWGGWGGVTNDTAGPGWGGNNGGGAEKSGWGDWGSAGGQGSKSKEESGKVVTGDWGATSVNGGGGWGGKTGGSHVEACSGWGGNTAGGNAGSGGGWGGVRTCDGNSNGEAGSGWGGKTSGGNAGSSGGWGGGKTSEIIKKGSYARGGWGNKTCEDNVGISGGCNDGKTTDSSSKDGWGGGGGSQGEADGAWGSKTSRDNAGSGCWGGGKTNNNDSKDGWGKSGTSGSKVGGGWSGKTCGDNVGDEGGSKTSRNNAGSDHWGGGKTNDSEGGWGKSGASGGKVGGGWSGKTCGDNAGAKGGSKTSRDNAGSDCWGGGKTNDISPSRDNAGSDCWGGGKTNDNDSKDGWGKSGASGGKVGGGWSGKTCGDITCAGVGSKTSRDIAGSSCWGGGGKTNDNDSKDCWGRSGAAHGKDGGGWGGKTCGDIAGAAGGCGGWKTSDSSSKGGGGGWI